LPPPTTSAHLLFFFFSSSSFAGQLTSLIQKPLSIHVHFTTTPHSLDPRSIIMRVSVGFASLLTLAPLAVTANPIVQRDNAPAWYGPHLPALVGVLGSNSLPKPCSYEPKTTSSAVAADATTSSIAPKKPTSVAAYKPASTTQPALAVGTTTPAPAADTNAKVAQSKAPSINDRNFQIYVLNAHNGARAKHGAPYLQWDNNLAQAAQTWANTCIWEHSVSFFFSSFFVCFC
jgi:hypothetical protein